MFNVHLKNLKKASIVYRTEQSNVFDCNSINNDFVHDMIFTRPGFTRSVVGIRLQFQHYYTAGVGVPVD